MSGTRRKIIFVMSSMDNGGAERALLNLLEELPRERYDVSLLLLNPSGLFMDQIPNYVHLVDTPKIVADCFSSARQGRHSVRHVLADVLSTIYSRDPETRRRLSLGAFLLTLDFSSSGKLRHSDFVHKWPSTLFR